MDSLLSNTFSLCFENSILSGLNGKEKWYYGPARPKSPLVGAVSLPSSALGRAANYTITLWRKLTRFLEYPELELSDNLVENSMRTR